MVKEELSDLQWEWEAKKDSWVRYDKASNEELNNNFEVSVVALKIEESDLEVDRMNMRQKNRTTGFERSVRCCIEEADGSRYAWEWQDEKRRWRSYPPNVVRQLESAHTSNESVVNVVIAERAYTIDLSSMEQKNDTSNVEKKVRRVASVAESAMVATPAPSAVRTRSMAKRKVEDDTEATTSKAPAKSQKAAAAKRSAKRTKLEDDDDEDQENEPRNTSRKSKKGASDGKSEKRKIVIKGRAPVDSECDIADKVHVYCEGNDVYDAMLNQTNVQNNNNKYYLIQLLEEDSAKRYSVWMRWGRVGFRGQNSLVNCGPDLNQAKDVFCKKFADKTKNEWSDRAAFEKVPGKYDLLEMDYSINGKTGNDEENVTGTKPDEPQKDVKPIPESTLDERVQALLKLICDIRAMEETVTEMEFDAVKAPLGKMTSTQIKAGYAALKKIEGCIESNDFGKTLVAAVNDYYTRVPHCFGMRQPPLIKTTSQIRKEMELLEALEDIEVAIRTLKSDTDSDVNPIDRHYHSMKCDLKPLDPTDKQYALVEKYLQTTHATTHNTYKMRVKNVFEVEKHGEKEQFQAQLGNRKLLWHGSRITNWYGILSQGLRIAPPEAPVTGYMFGKGVYFADVSSKSSNYCFATRSKPTGLVVLADVALGKTRDVLAADYKADKNLADSHSTRGLGQIAPDSSADVVLDDGCVVPCGKLVSTGVDNPSGYTLNYNEYVVYNTNQIRVRYLVEVDFQF